MVGRVEEMSSRSATRSTRTRSSTRYGADTARWFMLSDNPPERDMEWTEAGVAGAFRFTQRVFRLVEASGGCRRRADGRRREAPLARCAAPRTGRSPR